MCCCCRRVKRETIALIIATVGLLLFIAATAALQHVAYEGSHYQVIEAGYCDEHAPKTFWRSTICEPVNLFTFLLTIFTAVLAVSTIALWWTTRNAAITQARDMKASIDAAAASANAAKESFDATLALERPHLFVTGKLSSKGGDDPNRSVSYVVNNLGRAPAFIRMIYAECAVIDGLEPTPTYSRAKFNSALCVISANGGLDRFPPAKCEKPITTAEDADLREGSKMFVFKCLLLYSGALDFTYIMSATYQANIETGDFYAIGGHAWNYNGVEKGRSDTNNPPPLPNIVD